MRAFQLLFWAMCASLLVPSASLHAESEPVYHFRGRIDADKYPVCCCHTERGECRTVYPEPGIAGDHAATVCRDTGIGWYVKATGPCALDKKEVGQ